MSEPPHPPGSAPWIVGIGASAGGIEALSDLLSRVPPNLGMAYLVVLHLDRAHPSHLVEILGKATAIRVLAAQDGAPIEPDCVYVITPNNTLSVTDGRLTVTSRANEAEPHMPIDDLFSSLARERGPGCVAIVLSGTGTDGSLGATEVKAAGGITFAQDSGSAKFDAMPTSAVQAGAIDFILPPREIAGELQRIASMPFPPDDERRAAANEEDWNRLFRMLRGLSGVDFSYYKRATIRRRLARRMALRQAENLPRYLAVLQDEPAELDALYHDLLIRVTSFFRDPATYDALNQLVFPRIVATRNQADPIRIWVPGCSSGEEVYSIAIALIEFLGTAVQTTPVQIFGTDVNQRSIERARSGRYIANLFANVAPERIERFFTKLDGEYEVDKTVRDLCIFAEHNVARDPPFSKLDMVSCRNLLIYLDATMQKRVLGLFHYALKPDRFLLVAPSESAGPMSELFEVVDSKAKLYRRVTGSTPATLEPRRAERPVFRGPGGASEPGGELLAIDDLQREADHMLLARYAPAGILIDQRMNVLQFRGSTGRFLEHQPGAASLTLAKLVHPALLVELSNAINEARASGAPVRRDGLRNEREPDGEMNVEVVPLAARADHPRCFVILFDAGQRDADHGQPPRRRSSILGRLFARSPKPDRAVAERDELKRELAATRTYLQATVEANEAAQEELRSANEEVLSANEEFQSTNEELETAKEELQSANEELSTTNDELRHRNLELSDLNLKLRRARDYSQAIVETVRQPLLLLDGDQRVRRANRAFCEMFRVSRAETEGCLFGELGDGEWRIPALREGLASLARGSIPSFDLELRRPFPEVGERTLHFEARKLHDDPQHGELLLLSIDDVSERERVARAMELQAVIVDQARDAILAHDRHGPIRQWNRAAAQAYGWSAEEALGQVADELLRTRRPVARGELDAALDREGRWEGEQVHTTRDGREVAVHASYVVVQRPEGGAMVIETDRLPGQ